VLSSFARKAAGALASGIPCALDFLEGGLQAKGRAHLRRGNALPCLAESKHEF
jgi:hypothetical protein